MHRHTDMALTMARIVEGSEDAATAPICVAIGDGKLHTLAKVDPYEALADLPDGKYTAILVATGGNITGPAHDGRTRVTVVANSDGTWHSKFVGPDGDFTTDEPVAGALADVMRSKLIPA